VLFTAEMWERFNFYGMRAILILYLTAAATAGGFGLSKEEGSTIYGWYNGLAYLTPLIGGYIADNYLGRRRSIFIGGLLMMLGQFTLAFNTGLPMFFVGLGFIILGNGFFKPNISTMVGGLYPDGDARRDAAFTIFYMGINLGAFLAPLLTGYFAETEGFGPRWGFASAGVGMGLGLLTFVFTGQRYLGDLGRVPDAQRIRAEQKAAGQQVSLTQLSSVEWQRIIVLFVFVFLATMFWLGFEQAGSSMNLYTRDFIDRRIGTWEVPTGWFQSVNALFILIFGPVFAWLWVRLAAQGREPSTPVKMGLGLVLMGLGFLFLVGAVLERGGDSADVAIKASMAWMIIAYLFHTWGELCLSPVGLSVFTKLAPAQFGSLLMGVWFLSSFLAHVLGGYVAAYVETAGAYAVFLGIAAAAIGLGVVALLFTPLLRRMMHGVH